MKTITFIQICLILTISSFSNAQPKPHHYNTFQQPDRSWISKGYYSFANHEARLNLPPASLVSLSVHQQFGNIGKGYRSIGAPKATSTEKKIQPVRKRRPLITKGYYSIGNNADKLR